MQSLVTAPDKRSATFNRKKSIHIILLVLFVALLYYNIMVFRQNTLEFPYYIAPPVFLVIIMALFLSVWYQLKIEKDKLIFKYFLWKCSVSFSLIESVEKGLKKYYDQEGVEHTTPSVIIKKTNGKSIQIAKIEGGIETLYHSLHTAFESFKK
ncbi:hypothetical protein JW964_16700 [candidate division KSB1 bacterium]|nr:hypothetical protein [candidate division KSB1 bacterium]